VNCTYCTDDAKGYDEDNEPTCGFAETCTEVVKPLGPVIEVSDDDSSDEDE